MNTTPKRTWFGQIILSTIGFGILLLSQTGYNWNDNNHIVCSSRQPADYAVTDVDGNVYTMVTIGNQIWLVENLKTTHYVDGIEIPNITDDTVWSTLTTGAYCWYNDDSTNKGSYGALYNFYAVSETCGLCPDGWQVPTESEWLALEAYLGGRNVAGGRMKTHANLFIEENVIITSRHHHPRSVLHALTESERKLTFPDERNTTRELRAGDVLRPEEQTHIGENIGRTDTHVITVELKKPST